MASVKNRDGSYHIRCYCGTGSRGKRINKHLVWTPDEGMTQRQIERELSKQIAEFENRREQDLTVNSKITLEKYVNNIWLDRVRNELKPTTFNRYQQLLSRILPALGHYTKCVLFSRRTCTHSMTICVRRNVTIPNTYQMKKRNGSVGRKHVPNLRKILISPLPQWIP